LDFRLPRSDQGGILTVLSGTVCTPD